MLLDTNIRKVGEISVKSDRLLEQIQNYNWSNTYNSYLGNTGAILYPFRGGSCNSFITHPDVGLEEFLIINLSIPILKELENYFPDYKFVKGEMYCCHANTEQPVHIDPKVFHRFCKRIHIPLITNDNAYLQVQDEHYHLDAFSIYDFNNLVPHRSYNNGNSKRIHIIVDIMDPNTFDTFKKSGKYMELFEKSDHNGQNLDEYLNQLTKV